VTNAQRWLRAKHGTPDEFDRALSRACDDLLITPEEERAASAEYRRDWAEAGTKTPTTGKDGVSDE